MSFCNLPKDIIKVTIGYLPVKQWYLLCKDIYIIAIGVISPHKHPAYKGKLTSNLSWALYLNKTVAVTYLLNDPRVDPSADDNYAIQSACARGYKDIVMLLLQDTRVNPSAGNNYAIQLASMYGHKEIVELLLQDDRVDPSANDNNAIQLASWKGHKEIVEILLKDKRVDPSVLSLGGLIENTN